MKFTKYPSIENSYREEFIQKIIIEGKTDGMWNVTEKIHGANFSFWYDGKEFRMAKRTGWIGDDDNFYGIQEIKEDLIEKVKQLYSLIKPMDYIAVFGELYGGSYPHPEVKVDPKAKKVQKGVYYCPQNDFMSCDIKIDDRFLYYSDVEMYCQKAGLKFMTVIEWGSFRECLEYPNDFQSIIYREYDLPEIKDNICEGIVIRPDEPCFIFNHSRVMLTSKNDKFKEQERKKEVKVKVELSEAGKKASDIMIGMITDNRYDAVVSKIGEVGPQDFGKLQGSTMKDIIEELMKDTKIYFDYNNLEKSERKTINKVVGSYVANLIRKRLIGM